METDIQRLDSDIKRLQASSKLLSRKRDDLRQFSALHKGVLSSIRRFPPEILVQIYKFYPPDFQMAYRPAQVCRFWRSVAVSTAGLWTSFEMPLQEGREELELEMAQQWLARSRELPITFTLGRIRYKSKSGLKVTATHPCVKLLAAHAHRWRDATINIPTQHMKDLRSVQGNLILLESLSIGRSSEYRSPEPIFKDLFIAAPQLHKLKLGRRALEPILNVPWTQLTQCTLEGDYNALECYDVINNCPNLTYCEFAVTGISHPTTEDIDLRPSIVHPNIDVLKIRNHETLLQLLEHLELPALTEFAHTTRFPVMSLYTSTRSLFLRSTPPLRRLELDNEAHTSDSALIGCLEQCPSLQELFLTSYCASGVSKEFLHRLTHSRRKDRCCLVPKLHSLTVSISWHFNFKAFTKMIKSRWQGHGLECRAVDHETVEQLGQTTLCRISDCEAEDALGKGDKKPRWFHDLLKFQAEGFSLTSKGVKGVLIPLEEVVLESDSDDSDSDESSDFGFDSDEMGIHFEESSSEDSESD